MTHFTIKKYKGANTDVAACLTPSTYDLFAASLPFVNIAGFIFFQLEILQSADIGFVQSVFTKLFFYVSTYDLFRASLASIGVAK